MHTPGVVTADVLEATGLAGVNFFGLADGNAALAVLLFLAGLFGAFESKSWRKL